TSNFTASNGMLVGGTCELCVGDCRECLTNKECTVCENKMLLRNGTCEAKCPDGFWEKTGKNGVNGTCEHCSIGTKKCTAPQKAALISSLIDLGDGAAEPQAVECDPGVELKNGECVNPCPSGKYKDPES
ncbi:Fur2, partial [Symbiodinium sp. CCMP2456]